MSHFTAVHLDEISGVTPEFLNKVIRKDIASELFMYLLIFSVVDTDEYSEETCVVSFACRDCNQVYDIPQRYPEGHELEGTVAYICDSHPHVDIKEITNGRAEFEEYLHRTTLYLQLLNAVLASSDLKTPKELNQLENQLLLQDIKSRAAVRSHALQLLNDDSRVMDPKVLPLINAMLHFLHTKNHNYPLLAQNIAALLSLLIMRRPATVLACLLHDQFICGIIEHLNRINSQSFQDLSAQSVRFSVLSYLNIFPTLWHMTPMSAAQIVKFELEADVANLMMRWASQAGKAMACARGGCHCYLIDNPMDYNLEHAFFLWECPVREFFVDPNMVYDHPLRLAFVATVELLTKWKQWGISIAKHLHDEDNPQLLPQLMGVMESLSEMEPTLAHGYPLFKDLLENTNCTEEYTSVVRAAKQIRCHYPNCHKKKGLQACSGCSTAFYCCVEHQTKHWKMHKSF